MHSQIQAIYDEVVRRNRGEAEFHQAVQEVLLTLVPALNKNPQYVEAAILNKMVEPERQIIFGIPWVDDAGRVQMNRGFRVQFSSVLGPYKGGLRLDPSVQLGTIKFLGFEQVFKNALTGLRLGGGKGGSDFNPAGRSDAEIHRFCVSFMTELYRHIGPNLDVPAGDLGLGRRELGYLFGQYRRLTSDFSDGILTGKHTGIGGSAGRPAATGYGLALFADNILRDNNQSLSGMRVSVSGSGNVGIHAIEKAQKLGAQVVAFSDITGYITTDQAVDMAALRQVREVERAGLARYAELVPGAVLHDSGSMWQVPVDVAMPCATQNELNSENARALIAGGVRLVAEGANMPLTPNAVAALHEAKVLYAPGKAANAGGVAVSGLEMRQNAGLQHWTEEQVEAELAVIMGSIHDRVLAVAEEYGSPGDYVVGANIAGFVRVADAMLEMGI